MERKKLTVSVTPELKEKLDEMKKEQYSGTSLNIMLKELISAGLESLIKEDE